MRASDSHVRAARIHELPDLSALAFRSKASWGYADELMEGFRAELTVTRAELGQVFVGVDGDAVFGFYSLQPSSDRRVELVHLFVEPSQQRRGRGRALVIDATRRARRDGFQTLLIEGDPHASDFYARMGAVPIGERTSASIPGRLLPRFEIPVAPRGQPSTDKT